MHCRQKERASLCVSMFVLVFVVWLLVRAPNRDDREDALETLRSRLARGEITPDEFERARRLLEPGQDRRSP